MLPIRESCWAEFVIRAKAQIRQNFAFNWNTIPLWWHRCNPACSPLGNAVTLLPFGRVNRIAYMEHVILIQRAPNCNMQLVCCMANIVINSYNSVLSTYHCTNPTQMILICAKKYLNTVGFFEIGNNTWQRIIWKCVKIYVTYLWKIMGIYKWRS